MDRRSVLGLGAAVVAAASLQTVAEESQGESPDPTEVVPLWPGSPPGGEDVLPKLSIDDRSDDQAHYRNRIVKGVASPSLSVFRPDTPDGSALLIIPGGGYSDIVIDGEGFDPARRFNAAGITAFVLQYRLPSEGWADQADVPLQDAQRAMRLIRGRAQRLGIDGSRLGVLGFSAGGHLAASLATRYDAHVYDPMDDADSRNARPDFAALLYPVITMLSPYTHDSSRARLLGPHPSVALEQAYSCERLVRATTPPCFLVAAANDDEVPSENTLSMFSSLRTARVPAEMHLFEEGGHGFGIRKAQGKPVAAWPDLLLRWCARHGFVRATF